MKLGTTPKGGQKVIVTDEETGTVREYLIPHGRHLVVYEGDRVAVGEALTDGSINPHDILKVKDSKAVQEHLVNEIQEVYRLQGVVINDKHIEIIVRQMLKKVRVLDSADTSFLFGEEVDRKRFEAEPDQRSCSRSKLAPGTQPNSIARP